MNLTEQEFNERVFKEKSCSVHISLESVFSLDELLAISNCEEYKYYLPTTQSWIWSAIDNLSLREV